jgi:TonB family protein
MALFWLPLILLAAQAESAPQPIVLFDGRSFEQWVVEQVLQDGGNDALPVIYGNAALITRSFGWIRTRTEYSDFRLSLNFRPDPRARAKLYFRTWSRLDKLGAPDAGYHVPLADAWAATNAASGMWHRLVLDCRGNRAEVTINGQTIARFTGIENSAGYIGLRGESGVVWVRDVVLTPLTPTRSYSLVAERAGHGTGVTLPVLVHDVKPPYTADAMRERITGTVRMEVVVREDGTVGDVHLLQSVDAKYGMDEQCVATVRQWRFQPGTKNGVPVPVIVSIEMHFTLK